MEKKFNHNLENVWEAIGVRKDTTDTFQELCKQFALESNHVSEVVEKIYKSVKKDDEMLRTALYILYCEMKEHIERMIAIGQMEEKLTGTIGKLFENLEDKYGKDEDEETTKH